MAWNRALLLANLPWASMQTKQEQREEKKKKRSLTLVTDFGALFAQIIIVTGDASHTIFQWFYFF